MASHSHYSHMLGRLLRAYRIDCPIRSDNMPVPDPEGWAYLTAEFDGQQIQLIESGLLRTRDDNPFTHRTGLAWSGEREEVSRRPFNQAKSNSQLAARGWVDEIVNALWRDVQDPSSEDSRDAERRCRAVELLENYADPSALNR